MSIKIRHARKVAAVLTVLTVGGASSITTATALAGPPTKSPTTDTATTKQDANKPYSDGSGRKAG